MPTGIERPLVDEDAGVVRVGKLPGRRSRLEHRPLAGSPATPDQRPLTTLGGVEATNARLYQT